MEEKEAIKLEKSDEINKSKEDNSKRNIAKSLAFLSLFFCAISFILMFIFFGNKDFNVLALFIPLIVGLVFSIMSIVNDHHNFWGILFTLLYILVFVLLLFAEFIMSLF